MKKRLTLLVLVKHFLLRYVKNDDLQYDDQRTEFLIFGLIFIGGWSWYIADQSQKHFFITFMMVLTGIFCMVAWERLLLDEKDQKNLLVLPVGKGTLYFSKFLSGLAWIGIISFALSLLPAFAYTHRHAKQITMSGEYYFFILMISGMIANLFMFLLVAALQGILSQMLRGRLLAKVAVRVQTLLVMVLVSVFVWFPRLNGSNPGMESEFSNIHYFLPSLWFNGLHEYLTGGSAPAYRVHAAMALISLAVLLTVYMVCLSMSLKQKNGQGENVKGNLKGKGPGPMHRWFRKIWHLLVLRNPVERAVFYFFLQHLKRDRKTKLKLTLIMALPIGMVLTQMVEAYSNEGLKVFREVSMGQVAFPYIFFFLLAIALRAAVEQPVSLEANWIFRLTAVRGSTAYVRGLKKAMVVRTVLPLLFFLLVFYLYFWDTRDALLHIIYSLGMSLVLLEIFFFNYRKVPFASVYNPVYINFKLAWPVFGLMFLIYYFVFALLGIWILADQSSRYIVFPALLAILFFFAWYNRKMAHLGPVFEDKMEPVMLSLNL